MQIQDRDIQIMRLCYEQQFLTVDHVREFFRGRSEVQTRRRLRELEQSQFLMKEYHPFFGKRSLIRLDRMGLDLIRQHHRLPPPSRPNPATLIHDERVTSARLRLQTFWNAEFVPERAIKSEDYAEIPDGIFFFPSGHGIALEVENSDKGRKRFLKLLERWKDASKIVFVLYIASHEKLHASLKSYLSGAPLEQPVGLVLWDELKQGVPSVFTRQGEVDLFSQREF